MSHNEKHADARFGADGALAIFVKYKGRARLILDPERTVSIIAPRVSMKPDDSFDLGWRSRMLAMLRRVEWSAENCCTPPCCPACSGMKPDVVISGSEDHKPDCELAKLISDLETP